MKLTKQERLILWNLFEIRKLLTKDKREAESWELKAEIVLEGYENLYSTLVPMDADMPEEQTRFVHEVLDVYRRLDGYMKNNPHDAEVRDHPWSKFHGFDGNNETDLMAYCRFIVQKQGKWAEQLPNAADTDEFNSHGPTVDRYRKMVAEWKTRGKPYPLSAEDARAILDPKPTPAPPRGRIDDEDDPPRKRGDKWRV